MKKAKGPLFITGFPRSGTTLLRAILGSHPEIHLFHEPELIGGIRSAGFRIRDNIRPADRPRLLEHLNKTGACRKHLSALPPDILSRFIEDDRDLSFKETYELLLPKPDGVAVWGEKSLNNVFRLREVFRMYPDALVVHIVRDPRSALLSYYRKRFAHSAASQPALGRQAIRFFVYRTLQWCTWVAAVREALESLEKEVIELRYEDLVTNAELETRRICDALGLEFDQAMLDAARRKEDTALKRDGAYAHQRLLDPVDSARAHSGSELPGWATFIIERYAGEAMKSFGYALNYSAVSTIAKLRLIAELRLSETGMRTKLQRMVSTRLGGQFDFLVP
jgi:hypothetical protein